MAAGLLRITIRTATPGSALRHPPAPEIRRLSSRSHWDFVFEVARRLEVALRLECEEKVLARDERGWVPGAKSAPVGIKGLYLELTRAWQVTLGTERSGQVPHRH